MRFVALSLTDEHLFRLGKQRLGQTDRVEIKPSQLSDIVKEMVKVLEQFVADKAVRSQITTEWLKIPKRVAEN